MIGIPEVTLLGVSLPSCVLGGEKPPTPQEGYLLLQEGDYLLLQDGGRVLLEGAVESVSASESASEIKVFKDN